MQSISAARLADGVIQLAHWRAACCESVLSSELGWSSAETAWTQGRLLVG